MGELVVVQNGEARTTSLAVATGTGTQHKNVMELVRGYQDDLREFGLVAFETRPRLPGKHGGGNTEYATLNEPQATLLMTYMKNTPVVRQFKKQLVKAFYDIFHHCHDLLPDPDQIIKQSRLVELLEVENRYLKSLHATRPTGRDPKAPNFLFQRYTEISGGLSVSKWVKMMGIPYSCETVNGILYRNAKATAPTMACLMEALRFSKEEIADYTAGLGHAPGQGAWRKEARKALPPPTPSTEIAETTKKTTKGDKTMVPEIDVKATNAKFDERCIARSAWARSKGLNPATFYQRLNGHLGITPEIAELLRKEGLLVEKGC